MFIKAFFVRGDVQAARTVVGILKDEEDVMREQNEKRRIARIKGAMKKREIINKN
jgi:hypothetical protein